MLDTMVSAEKNVYNNPASGSWAWNIVFKRREFKGSASLSIRSPLLSFYRTRVRSLVMLVSDSLTNSLTHSCLVNFIDVTLACEDANSKLVDVVTVADDDRVGNNLLQIWKPRFGQKSKCLFRLWAKSLVKILKLKFRQDLKLEFGQFFSADVL